MGLGFWTKLDPVGQPSACTFADEADAKDFIVTWDTREPLYAYGFATVHVADPENYATIAECVAAGLDPWNPNE